MSRIDALQVTPALSSTALTPSQKRFNTLIRQIEQARQKLQAWNENVVLYRQTHAELMEPLRARLLAGLRQWVFALDAAVDKHRWSQADLITLREVLCEAASEMIGATDDDAEFKALFDKHADVDFETDRREKARVMKSLAEAMTGLDLGGEDDLDSDEALFERLHQGLLDQRNAEDAERDERKASRPRTAAQERREADAKQATQSVREVYRKLASALHPDREPDERQREAKTALMQRVNQAYEANDLLALLELQLQIEQIDASHLALAGEQRLKHYNKVLAEQLADLKAEIEHVEIQFCMEFRLELEAKLNPQKLGQVLERTNREWRAELERQQAQLRMLDDVAATKRWLKRERQARREAEFDFPPF